MVDKARVKNSEEYVKNVKFLLWFHTYGLCYFLIYLCMLHDLCYFLKMCLCVISCSAVSNSLVLEDCRLSPLCMEFSRQEYWSGLPFPSPGDLPDPGIKPGSSAFQVDSLLSEPPGKTLKMSSY